MKRIFAFLVLALVLTLTPFAASFDVNSSAAQSDDAPTTDNPRRVILDVDPGIDDALAILLALQSPELIVEAITVVSGNVIVDKGVENALKLVELAGADDVIVAKGAKYALQAPLITAEIFHGQNGIGDVELPTPTKTLDERHAADVIIDIVNDNPGEITLVPLGPLTNIALAFIKDPDLPEKVSEIIMMGGSTVGGNVTPAAEANVGADPEAAKIVFESGVPITMVGLGATSQALLTRDDVEILRDADNELATVAADIGEAYIDNLETVFGLSSANLHDPLAVGIAIDKGFVKTMWPMRIDVETKGGLTYGETVANRFLSRSIRRDVGDHHTIEGFERVEPNADVPTEIDGVRFTKFFRDRMGSD